MANILDRGFAMADFPRSLIEFQRRFPDEKACAAYLAEARWPNGFRCPDCGHDKGWELATKAFTWECALCGKQTSVTAGTVMHASMYRARFLGHKTALCGLMRGDDGGHPIPPCFGGTSVAVLFQQPVLVVAIEVRPDGGADLLDVLEDATENDLLLQRSDEALGDRPLASDDQAQDANRCKLLPLRAVVVSVAERAGRDPAWVRSGETSESEPSMKRRNRTDNVKTGI